VSFAERRLDITIGLGKGDYGEAGADYTTFYSLRAAAQIIRTGNGGFSTATITLSGLPLSFINKISSLGKPITRDRLNTVSVAAGDAASGMGTVFMGTIQEAWADFNAAPDVKFTIEAMNGTMDKMRPIPPTSYPGPADVATVMETFARSMGYTLENNGVTGQIPSSYFPGTLRDQIEAARLTADIDVYFDDVHSVLVISPKGVARGTAIPDISPATGMIGYPAYAAGGISVRTLYNPAIAFMGNVKITSGLQTACGIWTVNKLSHNLEAQTPNGAWFTEFEANRLGDPTTIPR
jgi:hypothetical protein